LSPSLKARLAHEIKTPVSAIAAAAEIMKDERFGPIGTARYLGYASDIHSSAQHALAVIERMLAEARHSSEGEKEDGFDFVEIDAAAMLRTAVSQIAPLAERAGIALTLELAPRLPHVIADATSLRQILLNLLTNALKFTPPGGRVTVSARYSPDGPLEVAVSDTGSGMPRPDRKPPVRAEPRRGPELPNGTHGQQDERHSGLGIGLPLVRALAAANGAELIIDSAPGTGTSAAIVFARDRVVPI
jgi:signal transduction histidine kinase